MTTRTLLSIFLSVLFNFSVACVQKRGSHVFETIFTGKISQFFAAETSGLIEVRRIFKGDHRYQGNFVIVEGFNNCHDGGRHHFAPKVDDTRVFYVEKVIDGNAPTGIISRRLLLTHIRRGLWPQGA